ncbi:MAG: VirB4 family type IV secretion system protein, partial [Candidatus Dormibacteria bacterium]
RTTSIGPYVIDGDAVRHPDGSFAAVVRTGELDIESLDPERRAAVLSQFARLCHTLDSPLQIVVQVRAANGGGEPATAQVGANIALATSTRALDESMSRYWAHRLAETPAYTREVLLVPRAPARAELAALTTRISESVQAMGIAAVRLENDALDNAVQAGLDRGRGLTWCAHPHHLSIGGLWVRSFAMRRLPGHSVGAGWLAPMLRVSVECDIAIHLAPASLGDALHTLGRRLRDFSAHRLLERERGVIGDVHVDIALDSAFELRHRLASNIGRPVHLSITASVRAARLDELRRSSDAIRVAMSSALISAEPAHFRHLAAFVTTLPLGVDQLRAVKLVESAAAAVCVPWVDAGCADPGGYRLGAALRAKTPIRVAPFDARRHMNANIAVLAASGHGKSFALGALMLEAAAQGVDCVVIDPEGEYARVVEALGGAYVSLAPGGEAAVNVFDASGGDEDAVAALVGLVNVLRSGQLSDLERALVDRAAREALEGARRAGRVALLHDCIPALERDAPAVAAVIARHCSGALGMLFDRETSVRIERGVAGISLHDTPAEHVAAVTFIVAGWLWGLVRNDPRPRHILFDEVGALCVHPPLRELLVQLARRCRKYSASLVVATQNAQDLLATDEGAVVVTNCGIALLGGHRAAEAARMEQAFGLTSTQRRLIETAARGEFLLLAGDRRVAMRVEVPPSHEAILRAPTPLTSGEARLKIW